MGRSNKKKWGLVIILTALAIILFLANLFIQAKQIRNKEKEFAALKAQLQEARNKVNTIPKLEEELSSLKLEATKFKEILPTVKEVSYDVFGEKLGEYANKLNISITSFKEERKQIGQGPARKETQKSPVEPATFAITTLGNFWNSMQFLYLLETDKRFIRIDSLKITPVVEAKEAKKEKKLYFQVDFKVTTYTWRG